MVFCGPNHNDRGSAVVEHDAAAAPQLHDDATHPHQEAVAGSYEDAASDEVVLSDKFAKSVMHKCSVCASCCSAAAIHDTVPKLPAVEPVAADFIALAPAVAPFATDGPDRPPRHVLA